MGIFTKPCHIKKLFGGYFTTQQYTHIHTLEGHTRTVNSLTIYKDENMRSSIFSGSWDETIRVWDTDTHEEISNLKMHTENVNGLTFHENKLYSGNPYDLQIWDINRRQLKKKANMDWSQGGLSKVFYEEFFNL